MLSFFLSGGGDSMSHETTMSCAILGIPAASALGLCGGGISVGTGEAWPGQTLFRLF